MTDRDELQQSFDPRTWTRESDEGAAGSPSRPRRVGSGSDRPPFFLAGVAAVAILSLGAGAAFMARPDSAGTSEIAAALETSSGALDDSDAGASVAGEQP